MAAATITTEPPLSVTNLTNIALRREAVDSVLGTMAAEGDVPSAETLRDFEGYIQGEIDIDEVTGRILRRALS